MALNAQHRDRRSSGRSLSGGVSGLFCKVIILFDTPFPISRTWRHLNATTAVPAVLGYFFIRLLVIAHKTHDFSFATNNLLVCYL
jgi:hypothetical protein